MGGIMDYRARFFSPSLGRFLQPDTLIPDTQNPQAWNRYAYALNNPIRYNDPSGHKICEDMDCKNDGDAPSSSGGSVIKGSDKKEGKYACVDGYGCFDTKHLRDFGYPGGQGAYWKDFKYLADLGKSFPITLSNTTDYDSSLSITYSVSHLEAGQYEGVAMGIYQHFSYEFEGFQLLLSNYANADLPSDYLGLVAAMHGQTPDGILSELGGDITYTDEEIPAASWIPGDDRNYEFTPRINVNGQYVNKPWPTALEVTPINDLWEPQIYHSSYFGGAWQAVAIYGSPGSFWCTTCGGGR
jgi:RHS repeat-associated protein